MPGLITDSGPAIRAKWLQRLPPNSVSAIALVTEGQHLLRITMCFLGMNLA